MNDIFGDVFRSFFGIPRREYPSEHSFPEDDEDQNDDILHRGDFFFFERPFPSFGSGMFPGLIHPDEEDDNDDSFHGNRRNGRDPFSMFDMFDEMRHLFEEFASHEIPGSHKSLMPPSNDSKSLRDKMLKEPENETPVPRRQDPFFGNSYRLPGLYQHPYSNPKQDSDLDEEIKNGNLRVIFDSDDEAVPDVRPYTSSTRISVHTYTNINGEVEERKTVKHGDGQEVTTITRRSGDKSQTIIKRKNKDGVEEIIENESDLPGFHSARSFRQLPPGDDTERSPASEHLPEPDTISLFRRLFGRDFPQL